VRGRAHVMLSSVSTAPLEDDLAPLIDLLAGRRFVALTGAGCSTESGIPDYRGGGRTGPRNPIQHDAFMRRPDVRRRYWARATLGWAQFSGAEPNAAHRALAALESAGPLAGVITQNVDRLHQRAGSRRVVELHGALADVACIRCGRGEPRHELQARLIEANPGWLEALAEFKPDGDAEILDAERVAAFAVVGCRLCDGELKPDVVFFGGTVAERTLSAAWALFDEAEALLVVGSSLAVYSGFRFVRRAQERALPIALVNIGPTRADDLAAAKIAGPVGAILPRLATALGVP
jgi:NAD-dependent protein deacetylase/lipoamidase sirtuin 4